MRCLPPMIKCSIFTTKNKVLYCNIMLPSKIVQGEIAIQMHWNLIWKSPGFVPFGANLTHFGAKSTIPGVRAHTWLPDWLQIQPDKTNLDGTQSLFKNIYEVKRILITDLKSKTDFALLYALLSAILTSPPPPSLVLIKHPGLKVQNAGMMVFRYMYKSIFAAVINTYVSTDLEL